jgi:very-short-patch-repair endonuclease
MGRKLANADARMADIAALQHGVVSVEQLRGVGIGEKGVRSRVRAGRLHRVHRGVYAVGHAALAPEGRWTAAVLAVGAGSHRTSDSVLRFWGAATSHRSAACLWNLLPVKDHPVEVIVAGGGGRTNRRGIRVHRSHLLIPADVTLRHRIPVTTPTRTIADLRRASSQGWRGALPPRELRKAIRQASVLGLPIGEQAAIGTGQGDDRTRSDLELDFLQLCRRHRLPAPEVNVHIGSYLVDFLWRDRRLIVETDGYVFHRGREAFQDDHSRDLDLKGLGYEVVRLSERQINEEPNKVAKTLAALLRER